MTSRETTPASHTPRPPRIHRAILTGGGVEAGEEISREIAIQERPSGHDVVVCGEDTRTNRRLAAEIEDEVGPKAHHEPPSSGRPTVAPALPGPHSASRGPHLLRASDNPS